MSNQVRESGRLSSRARRVFLSMASPFGFGGDPKLFCSLDTVNLPPMMGRADAAFEAAKACDDAAFRFRHSTMANHRAAEIYQQYADTLRKGGGERSVRRRREA